jgi:hypothetical protein
VSDEALPRGLVMIKVGKYQKGSENCWLKAIYHDRASWGFEQWRIEVQVQ